LIDDVIRQSAY